MGIERNIAQSILSLKDKYPVLAVTGPRQSGKTTMLKSVFPNYRYVNLENPSVLDFAKADPNGFLAEYDNACIFDEVQRAPELFSYIQDVVDREKTMGRYVLSGSQNFHLIKSITQSLAGRVALFKLFPLDNLEMKRAGILGDSYETAILKGCYPAIYDREIPIKTFFNNYIQTYIERDVSELLHIKDIRLFRNFISLCATRVGNPLNLASIARDCGISAPTASAWLALLESSYVVFLLPAYFNNLSKRITKAPKIYFYDSGLLCSFLKISSTEQIKNHPQKGMLFENYAMAEMVKQNAHLDLQNEMYYWRDSHENEVDLLIPTEKGLDYFEIKCTQTITQKLFAGLFKFKNIAGDITHKAHLIHAGKEDYEQLDVQLIPWNKI